MYVCGQDVWKYVEQHTNVLLLITSGVSTWKGKLAVKWDANKTKHPAGGEESAWRC